MAQGLFAAFFREHVSCLLPEVSRHSFENVDEYIKDFRGIHTILACCSAVRLPLTNAMTVANSSKEDVGGSSAMRSNVEEGCASCGCIRYETLWGFGSRKVYVGLCRICEVAM